MMHVKDRKNQPALTFEINDSNHEPKTNPIEGKL
jgi:hypothetical protein